MVEMNKKINEEIADSVMYFDKTVALLKCGADGEDVERLAQILRENGRYVYEVSEEKFCSKGGEWIASTVIVCDAATLSYDLEKTLERYIKENGRVFIMGGPIFGNTTITKGGIVLEGISPLYKTFREEDCDSFETLSQSITDKTISGEAPYVICPNVRPNGEGYGKGRYCRMLPVVAVKKEGGRDGGRRGYAAFFSFIDSLAHLPRTAGTRLGNVSPGTQGSEMAVIGMPLSSLLRMDGGEGLFLDMFEALDRGIFLFEAGTEKYVSKPSEDIKVGAKIISAARDYLYVTVRFTVNGVTKEKTVLTVGQNYTDVTDCFDGLCEGEYEVKVELVYEGRVIDCVTSELFVTNGLHSSNKEDFVTVDGDGFKLGGKPWRMFGMNYFPMYQVSLEVNDYWRGAFCKVIYTPSEIEKDLRHLKEMGINAVAIRVDSNTFDDILDPIKDFFYRCRRLGLKIMFSFCNITNPLYFNEDAFAYIMKELDIADDPTMFAHDFFWESGGGFVNNFWSLRFTEDWQKWLIERYGSYENAEKTFGIPLDRTPEGQVTRPPVEHYQSRDKKYHGLLSAYTRFITELAGRKWNRAVRIMKKYDPNHLYTNRIGHIDDTSPNAFVSAVAKHYDFMSMEAYCFTQDEVGMLASACYDRAAAAVSGNKPIAWVEFGLSLSGVGGLAVGTKQHWDGVRNRPLDWRLEEQRAYQEQFNTMFKLCDVKGSMPWFYSGGFRFTEHSDYGYVAPNGELRPVMNEYLKIGEWFACENEKRELKHVVKADPDGKIGHWTAYVFGEEGIFSKFDFDNARFLKGKPLEDTRVLGDGILAAKAALEEGTAFGFELEGIDTTSADTSLELCGNIPYPGYGPIKNLDSEFNFVKLCRDGECYEAESGRTLKLPCGVYDIAVEIGNTSVAKWLCGTEKGCAALKCGTELLSIDKDTPYLGDALAKGKIEIKNSGVTELRMTAVGRADFGEIFKLAVEAV